MSAKITLPHKTGAVQHAIILKLDSCQSITSLASETGKECVERLREEPVPLKHHLTLALLQPALPNSHSHPSSPHSLLDFLLSSPLCPRVISLMMCNALKVFHQPDLLKRSMGNALGHFFSHPCFLSLSLPLPLVFLIQSSLLSSHCPEPCVFPSAFLSCLTQLSPRSLSLVLDFCCFALPSVAFELGL